MGLGNEVMNADAEQARIWSGAGTVHRRSAETATPAAIAEHVRALVVSQGPTAGDELELFPWEADFLEGAFAPGVNEAALSIGRGNGKTTFLAAVAHAAIAGPLAQPRAEVVVIASSFEQARLTFDHVLAFGGYWSPQRWRVWNTGNSARIESRVTGARLRCLGSDPRRAHGLAPVLVLADEPAQWPPTTADAMAAALRTALGKITGARMVALGTRPALSEHWFERMLNGGPGVYAQRHAADRKDDPNDPATWLKANPSLPAMPQLQRIIEAEAQVIDRDPSALASFQALRLNMGVSDVTESLLLNAGVWESCEREAERAGPMVLGVDLGGSAAMSAASAYWPATGRLECLAAFPRVPGLGDRGLQDGVADRYERMADAGELLILGERVVAVPEFLTECLERWGEPAVVVADRWREAELRQSLEAAEFPSSTLTTRGQGFLDGGQDVREFRRAALAGRIAAPVSLLLRSALSEARVTGDPAGNWKLAKGAQGGRRARARDDAAAASILAVAEGARRQAAAATAPAASRVLLA